MNTHNIGFYEDLTKIIFELPSNTHLISSTGDPLFCRGQKFLSVRPWLSDPVVHLLCNTLLV